MTRSQKKACFEERLRRISEGTGEKEGSGYEEGSGAEEEGSGYEEGSGAEVAAAKRSRTEVGGVDGKTAKSSAGVGGAPYDLRTNPTQNRFSFPIEN